MNNEKLIAVSGKALVRFFLKQGFIKKRQKGSHIILKKTGITRPLVIPDYKELSHDIILNNLKTAGISKAKFNRTMQK